MTQQEARSDRDFWWAMSVALFCLMMATACVLTSFKATRRAEIMLETIEIHETRIKVLEQQTADLNNHMYNIDRMVYSTEAGP